MKTTTLIRGGLSFILAMMLAGFVSSEALAQEATVEEEETIPLNQQGGWISDSGVSVTTGDYGTDTDTTITELYETIKYRASKGELGVTIPYLFRNGNSTTVGESRPVQGGIPDEADGIGDIQLKGKYYWLTETGAQPSVDLMGRIKIPTASEDDGLGTGHVDVGFGPEFTKLFGSLITFINLELVLRDKPDGSSIKSTRLDYALGMGYPLTEQFTGYLSLEGGTPIESGSDAPLEAVMSGVYKLTPSTGLNGYALVGLSDGSPDYGGGVSITFRF